MYAQNGRLGWGCVGGRASTPGCSHDARTGDAPNAFSYTSAHSCFCRVRKQPTPRQRLSPGRRAAVEKTRSNKRWRGCGWRRESPRARLVGTRAGGPLWETVWGRRKTLNTGLPRDPAVPLLGVRPRTWKLRLGKPQAAPGSPQRRLGGSPAHEGRLLPGCREPRARVWKCRPETTRLTPPALPPAGGAAPGTPLLALRASSPILTRIIDQTQRFLLAYFSMGAEIRK